MRVLKGLVTSILLIGASSGSAQESVVAASDPDALFTSPDPVLQANKQVVYHIVRDLLGAGRWDEADKYLTERYIQHNPNVPSGREAIVSFGKAFTGPVKPIPTRIQWPVVAVLAEGDLVTVISKVELPDPRNPGKTYTTSGFDMWRIKDGKADEHWDAAPLMPPPHGK